MYAFFTGENTFMILSHGLWTDQREYMYMSNDM